MAARKQAAPEAPTTPAEVPPPQVDAPAPQPPMVQVEQAPPVRVEIRIGGRIRFANDVYDVALSQEPDGLLKLTGALHPTMVSVALRPPERFGDDPRESEEPILQVHSGKQTKE